MLLYLTYRKARYQVQNIPVSIESRSVGRIEDGRLLLYIEAWTPHPEVAVSKREIAEASEEFDPRVSLSLERVIIERDYAMLSSMRRDDPEGLRKGLERLENIIAENNATDCLDKLCADHCDRRALLWLLHPFSGQPVFKAAPWSEKPGPGSMRAFLGLPSKKLDSLTKKLNAVAIQLEIVNEQAEFSSLLMMNRQLYPVYRLPRTLRTCARLMQYAAEHFAGNNHIYHNIAKARLTSYVLAKLEGSLSSPRKKRKREFRDAAVATLISAVSGDKDFRYDSTAHRIWRGKHYRRLSMLDPDVDQLFVD